MRNITNSQYEGSNKSEEEPYQKTKEEQDLEDGEIEDDEEETPTVAEETPKVEEPAPVAAKTTNEVPIEKDKKRDKPERSEKRRHDEKGKKHMTEAERSILHLRKKEEMQRKKWEKFRSKEAVADPLDDDFAKNIEKTLATILSKKEKEAAALASGEEKEKDKTDDKRGKKRKKNEKDRKNKQRKLDSPKSEIDENEMINMRGGSPERRIEEMLEPMTSMHSEGSYESDYSSDPAKVEEKLKKRDNRKGRKNREKQDRRDKNNKNRDKDRDKNKELLLKDSQGVCVFYLQGKCQKDDCPYSHEAVPPMKLELCKFYMMDCCAKGDKCSYMHSEFPCKFYHTGIKCSRGDDCKFAHGKPLSDGLKQILFKHIETAPRDILGGFPRMSREEALNMINATQNKLQEQHGADNKQDAKGGIPSLFDISVPVPPELLQGNDDGKGKSEKPRNRPSRWQDPDPHPTGKDFPLKPFNYGQDLDMRINSNGDVDMRTLPPPITAVTAPKMASPHNRDLDLERYKREAGLLNSPPKQDLDIRHPKLLPFPVAQDIDIRQQPGMASKDIDIRQIPKIFDSKPSIDGDMEDEPMLQIDTGEDKPRDEADSLPVDLPKTQRDLFLRIQAQQKENVVQSDVEAGYVEEENINWYSDDDDDDENRLTIKVDNEEYKDKDDTPEESDAGHRMMSPPQIKPQDVVEKLGDLSKIDISAEVTKILTSMSQGRNQFPFTKLATENVLPASTEDTPQVTAGDPRPTRQDPRTTLEKSDSLRPDRKFSVPDPRQRNKSVTADAKGKSEKLSIYEQGSIDRNAPTPEEPADFRGMRSDVDLRNLQLPFKGMQNYTPASEIDASINSHLPMQWKVQLVEIPRPDYTGLKLSINDAEKTGDPRLRKIFRLSTEERDTPLSPKASPKAGSSGRVDPRLRKTEDAKTEASATGPLSYTQQMNMLTSSAFYQSLSSTQKRLLNQELSQRTDSSNTHDPALNSLLSNLDIMNAPNLKAPNLNAALSILSNTSPKMGPNQPMVGQMVQPGLLGAAPGVPNLPPDFPINFDPRNGGLLGNAPMPFGGFPPPQDSFPFTDEFYPPPDNGGNFQGGNGGNFQGGNRERGFNRERRRGRSNFHNRNAGNRNFRNRNRTNRTHSPP